MGTPQEYLERLHRETVARKARGEHGGCYVHVGETTTCTRTSCKATLRYGAEVWMDPDGTILCLECHPKRPKVLDVVRYECLICGTEVQAPEDGEAPDRTCSDKCAARLRKKNGRSARKAEQNEGRSTGIV